MTLTASFLAGSLLTLLLPTLMLIALVVWYLRFVRRVPETSEVKEPGPQAPTAAATEGPELSHTARHID